MRRRRSRALRRRYGRALPLVLLARVGKLAGPAVGRLRSAELAEKALEPVVHLGQGAWGWVTGHRVGKKKKRRKS